MKILFLIAAFGLSGAIHAQDEMVIPAADEWFKTQYAPLYDDKRCRDGRPRDGFAVNLPILTTTC